MARTKSETSGGAKAQAERLELYRTTAADLRRCLMLGDIAAGHGNARRAAWHLIGALDELKPELRALRNARMP